MEVTIPVSIIDTIATLPQINKNLLYGNWLDPKRYIVYEYDDKGNKIDSSGWVDSFYITLNIDSTCFAGRRQNPKSQVGTWLFNNTNNNIRFSQQMFLGLGYIVKSLDSTNLIVDEPEITGADLNGKAIIGQRIKKFKRI